MTGTKPKEREYYDIVKAKFERLFATKYSTKIREIHLEVTAGGRFSNRLKAQIPPGRDIIFAFLKSAPPDISGYIELQNGGFPAVELVVVELKLGALKLDDVYQAHKYGDLLDASHVFLISLQPIPEEMKRLSQVVFPLLKLRSGYVTVTLATFEPSSGNFAEWFPGNPFSQ